MAYIYYFALIFILLVPNTFYMVTDLIHLNQFTFDFYVQLNLIEWLYFTFLLLSVFLRDLLHGSHICSFISFHFKAMVKSMFINSTYVLNGLGILWVDF